MPLRRTAPVLAVALSAFLAAPAALAEPATSAPASALAEPADAGPVTTKPVEAAAGWLARQLVDGERFETVIGPDTFPDQGLTIDALLALDAAGVAQDNAAKALAWLEKPETINAYVTDEEGSQYAGAYAKLALAVLAQGKDPANFGGVDLIAGLTALQAPSGRFTDKTSYPSDFTNNFSQSIAVVALERHGTAPEAAVTFLAGSACPDGGFPLQFAQATCTSQVDATAMAVQALLAAGRTADAADGVAWLAGRQLADGGFPDNGLPGDKGTTSNANSTGLAAQALRVGGRDDVADRAVAYLTKLQVGCAGAATGAINYDAGDFQPGNAIRATSQAILGLTGVSLADISSAGDKPAAPVLDCPAPTTTTEPSTSDTDTPAGFAGSGGDELARTGVPVGPALWLGTLLLVAGALAMTLGRKRYATVKEQQR
ncbi:peptidase [Actinosynnema sp. CS-041913]|uniref:peptidase n=1 Tax=Actinosynnema sp. CS-041913 TaxID=3239917 RepID=UPI003D8C4900